MEPTPETLEHLRYEALAIRCRAAISEQLQALDRQLAEIQSTRSPFAVFARRETKEAFNRSLQSTEQDAAALRQCLVRLEQIEARITPLLHAGIAEFLWRASSDYQQIMQSVQAIDGWVERLNQLGEPLLAFARELRESRSAGTGAPFLRALATARTYAQILEVEHGKLAAVARQVDGVLALSSSPLRLPELPELTRTTWVQRVASLSAAIAHTELTQVEAVMRQFLAEGVPAAAATARSCRAACEALAERFHTDYWSQLRAFAQENWAEEVSLDEALQKLTVRYVDADLVRRQHEIQFDPFQINR